MKDRPQYRYLEKKLQTIEQQQAVVLLLAACDRLQIPPDDTPFADYWLNPNLEQLHKLETLATGGACQYQPQPLKFPPFRLKLDTWQDWRERMQAEFERHIDEFKQRTLADIERRERAGEIVRPKQYRETAKSAPIELRFEWAALHLCWNMNPAEIAKRYGKEHHRDVIRKAVADILTRLPLARK